VTFSWTRDGSDVTRRTSSTGNTSIVKIFNARRKNSGSYVCTVMSGSLSVMSNAATVNVLGVLFVCSCDRQQNDYILMTTQSNDCILIDKIKHYLGEYSLKSGKFLTLLLIFLHRKFYLKFFWFLFLNDILSFRKSL